MQSLSQAKYDESLEMSSRIAAWREYHQRGVISVCLDDDFELFVSELQMFETISVSREDWFHQHASTKCQTIYGVCEVDCPSREEWVEVEDDDDVDEEMRLNIHTLWMFASWYIVCRARTTEWYGQTIFVECWVPRVSETQASCWVYVVCVCACELH